MEGQRGGLTHVQFTCDGGKLLAGGRKDDEILVWDMRNPGEEKKFIYSKSLRILLKYRQVLNASYER